MRSYHSGGFQGHSFYSGKPVILTLSKLLLLVRLKTFKWDKTREEDSVRRKMEDSMIRLRWLLTLALVLFPGLLYCQEAWKEVPQPSPLPTPLRSGLAPVNGVQIYFAVFGAGPPLVLLHGGLANSEYWCNQVPVLAQHYQVIVMDSRGHGRSTRDRQRYTYGLMASDVVGLLDYLKIRKASVVGWSDGGIIGLDLAIHHRERLDKLFAFAANADPSGLTQDLAQNEVFNRFIAQAGQAYRRLSSTPDDYARFVKAITQMWDSEPHYSHQQLANITTPTAIVDGEFDEAIQQSHTEQMARLIPGAQCIILPKVSHFAMLQNPAQFNEAVLSFLGADKKAP